MINNVRNTVLSILNKDNRGYIGPEEFNQYATQAQLEIFEKYFYDYTEAISKRNHSKIYTITASGTDYADIAGQLEEVIDKFVVNGVLHYNGITLKFYKPGEDPLFPNEAKAYSIDRLIYNDVVEVEKVSRGNILNLNDSLVAPSVTYPVYTLDNQGAKIYPSSITSKVMVDYIRYP